jgi:hypothetical protein
MTPFEMCAHLLLFEPAANESLNHKIVEVLGRYGRECAKVRHPDDDVNSSPEGYYEYRRLVLDMDVIVLDFLRTKFYDEKDHPDVDMRAIALSISLLSIDMFSAEIG